jgi:hypothetical protein
VKVELVGMGARNISKSMFFVNSLAIQRSLSLLEHRYRELRGIDQKRYEQLEALEQERQARQEAEKSLAEAEAALGAVSGSLRQLVQR